MTTLAVRNNNPLNIRAPHHGQAPWRGQTGSNQGFCVFQSPVYGFRAAAKILHRYIARGTARLCDIIETWAPPSENNDNAYIEDVCQHSCLTVDATIGAGMLPALIKAMAIHESGGWLFTAADLAEGIALA